MANNGMPIIGWFAQTNEGVPLMTRYAETITAGGRPYKIEVVAGSWTAYRQVRGHWQKIPAFTRADCNQFPKLVAREAVKIWKKYIAQEEKKTDEL
jgi:hypothetical protein